MKILFNITNLGKGGAERVIANLANYLSSKDDITILTEIPYKVCYDIDRRVNIIIPKHSILYRVPIVRNLKQIREAKKSLDKVNPDIIVSFMRTPSFCVILANKKNIPVVVSVRNDPKKEYKGLLSKSLVRLLYTKASGFVFQTEEAKRYFSTGIQEKSTIIPNSINKKFIKKSYDKEREKTIVNVARLEKQKNQILLIDAFNKINEKYKDYKLLIYGKGSLQKKLEKYSENNKNIIFKGISNNLEDEIYKAGMFVLSSNYEGMPNTLMEAMAMGLPVISTNCPCGGPKFLIENNENGILIDVNNKEQLFNAIMKIIDNKEFSKKISNNATHIANEKVNPDIINAKWYEYIHIIGEGK